MMLLVLPYFDEMFIFSDFPRTRSPLSVFPHTQRLLWLSMPCLCACAPAPRNTRRSKRLLCMKCWWSRALNSSLVTGLSRMPLSGKAGKRDVTNVRVPMCSVFLGLQIDFVCSWSATGEFYVKNMRSNVSPPAYQ